MKHPEPGAGSRRQKFRACKDGAEALVALGEGGDANGCFRRLEGRGASHGGDGGGCSRRAEEAAVGCLALVVVGVARRLTSGHEFRRR